MAHQQMNGIHDIKLSDEYFIDHFVVKQKPSLDNMPDDDHANLKYTRLSTMTRIMRRVLW